MGPESPGGIESHLQRTKNAVIEWLQWDALPEEDKVSKRNEWILLGKEDEEPTQPDALKELYKLRRFNFAHLPYPAGMRNQPHIWLLEIHATIDAEMQYQQMVKALARMKQKRG